MNFMRYIRTNNSLQGPRNLKVEPRSPNLVCKIKLSGSYYNVKSDRCHLVIYTMSEISPYIKVCHRWHQVFGNNWTDHYTSSHNFSCHTHTQDKKTPEMAHSIETIPLMAFSEGKS